ncbi:hypothetical protein KSF_087090 [Reticulibacter mediterranei]|uniref:Uncharacterized protein n=1 Tax=Reticulibacter mediterranei TaxID=2778369 RepID=A0A8J3J0L7_9CHLR|nr:hypothetical protein [Reticulibacter mediterranei]GHO98661.1 hypothetical protein KSF_087090 [Reticulibacter mediterranei]
MKLSDASGWSESVAVAQPMQKVLDYKLSRLIMHAIGAVLAAPYDNAWRAWLAFPNECEQAMLIEGFLVIDLPEEVILCEHGWLQQKDGSIIDPTILVQPLPPGARVFYVAGVQRTRLEVAVLLGKPQQFPAVRSDPRFGEDGMGHPQYRAAFLAARDHCLLRARLGSPPKEIIFLLAQEPDANLTQEVIGGKLILETQGKEPSEGGGDVERA